MSGLLNLANKYMLSVLAFFRRDTLRRLKEGACYSRHPAIFDPAAHKRRILYISEPGTKEK